MHEMSAAVAAGGLDWLQIGHFLVVGLLFAATIPDANLPGMHAGDGDRQPPAARGGVVGDEGPDPRTLGR